MKTLSQDLKISSKSTSLSICLVVSNVVVRVEIETTLNSSVPFLQLHRGQENFGVSFRIGQPVFGNLSTNCGFNKKANFVILISLCQFLYYYNYSKIKYFSEILFDMSFV